MRTAVSLRMGGMSFARTPMTQPKNISMKQTLDLDLDLTCDDLAAQSSCLGQCRSY